MAGFGAQADDRASGLQEGVDAFDVLQRDGRDIFGDLLALVGGAFDIRQFEDLAPGMRPARRAEHRGGLVTFHSLLDAGPAHQVPGSRASSSSPCGMCPPRSSSETRSAECFGKFGTIQPNTLGF